MSKHIPLLKLLQKLKHDPNKSLISATKENNLLVCINKHIIESSLFKGEITKINKSVWKAPLMEVLEVRDKRQTYKGVAIPFRYPCVAIEFEAKNIALQFDGNYSKGVRVTLKTTAIFTIAGTFLGFTPDSTYTNGLKSFCQGLFLHE